MNLYITCIQTGLDGTISQLGQVSRKFAAAKNGQVSSKFAAAKNGQVSSKFAASRKMKKKCRLILLF